MNETGALAPPGAARQGLARSGPMLRALACEYHHQLWQMVSGTAVGRW